jgi:predicted acyl esterase
MIAAEILRGRFHEGFDHPTAITPGAVTPWLIDLHTNDHAFLKGHRIMVQIQSTWFPLYDANSQTFVENIFTATHRTTRRLHRSFSARPAGHPTLSYRWCSSPAG